MRRSAPFAVLCVCSLTLLALAAVPSCKREQRTFEIPAADAKKTWSTTNTSQAPGGRAAQDFIGFEPPAPPPDDLESNANELAQGQLLFHAMNCSGCHGGHGGGGIGPPLSDEQWIYGWQPQIIFDSILYGRPNGMPAFRGKLSDRQVWQLVGYVRSLSGFASSDAAAGREDHMTGGVPPNSKSPPHPIVSTTELDELRHRQREEYQRMGWIDPLSGKLNIPDSALNAATHPTVPPATAR